MFLFVKKCVLEVKEGYEEEFREDFSDDPNNPEGSANAYVDFNVGEKNDSDFPMEVVRYIDKVISISAIKFAYPVHIPCVSNEFITYIVYNDNELDVISTPFNEFKKNLNNSMLLKVN